MGPALLEILRQQMAVRPLGRAATRRRNRLVDLQPRQRRGENAGRARAADGGAGRIAGRQQGRPAPRRNAARVAASSRRNRTIMSTCGAPMPRSNVVSSSSWIVVRCAPGRGEQKAISRVRPCLVDQGEGLDVAKSPICSAPRGLVTDNAVQIDGEPRLVGVVLEFADRAPGADAPAVGGLGEMAAHDSARIFGQAQRISWLAAPGDGLDDAVDRDGAKADAVGGVDHFRLQGDAAGPSAATLPPASTTTRSAKRAARPRSCRLTTTQAPRAASVRRMAMASSA